MGALGNGSRVGLFGSPSVRKHYAVTILVRRTEINFFPECVFEQGELELRSGGYALLFTDSGTEVTNNEDEEFGEDHLIEVLSENRALGALEIQKKVMEDRGRVQ